MSPETDLGIVQLRLQGFQWAADELIRLRAEIAESHKREKAMFLVLKDYDGSRAIDQWDEDICASRKWENRWWEVYEEMGKVLNEAQTENR